MVSTLTEIQAAQHAHDGLAGQLLVRWRDSVLQVEDQPIGAAARGLGEHGRFVTGT